MVTTSSTVAVLLLFAVLFVVSTSLYVFFVAASLAVSRSRIGRIEEMVAGKRIFSRGAQRILKDAESFLVCAQFGRLLASLVCGFTIASLSFVVSHDLLGMKGVDSMWAAMPVALGMYIVCASLILLVVQVTKAVSIQFPEDVLRLGSIPLEIHSWMWRPILMSVRSGARGVLEQFGVREAHEREVVISAAELGEIAKVSSEAGTLEKDAQQLLEGVAELSGQIARDVMTPRKDIVWVCDAATTEDVLAVLRKEPVSRLLVCGEDLDDVRGILLTWNLLEFVGVDPDPSAWRRFIRPVYRIPDSRVVRELLLEMRHKQIHFSVVLNEHGEVVGVVTLEDLVEEIVGEIFDEFEHPDPTYLAAIQADGSICIEGATSIPEFAVTFSVNLPSGDYQTVGGFVQEQLGRVPVQGDTFSTEGLTFSVLEMNRHRIVRLLVRKIAPLGGADGGATSVSRRIA